MVETSVGRLSAGAVPLGPGTSSHAPHGSPRSRILNAFAQITAEQGEEAATVTRAVAMAGVARPTFYAYFADRGACLAALLEEAVEQVTQRAGAAYRREAAWTARIRAGLVALLEWLDENPALARICVGRAVAAGLPALTRGCDIQEELVALIDAGSTGSSSRPPQLVAEGVIGGALGVIHAHLLAADPEPLVGLADPLMSMIVLPYRGERAALRELSRESDARTRRGHRSGPADSVKARRARVADRTCGGRVA